MKAFVISYNRLTWLRNLCDELHKAGLEVVIIDNCSFYQTLLDWFNDCPYEVVKMDKNYGHQVLWNELPHLITDRYYIVTDPDLDISHLPDDWLEVLKQGLELFPNVVKSGLSLEINDLPDNPYANYAKKWESNFWKDFQKGYYVSDIDTTLALYDHERKFGKLPNDRFFSAVRSDRPYTAKHLPFYVTPENITIEESFYNSYTNTYWSGKYKELI